MFITTSRVCLNQQTRQIDFAFLKNEPVLAFNVKKYHDEEYRFEPLNFHRCTV